VAAADAGRSVGADGDLQAAAPGAVARALVLTP
jgi:hypothetical protein